MTPSIANITPATGPTSGGDIVTLRGAGFASRIAVRFGGVLAPVVSVRDEAGVSIAQVRTPAQVEGSVDVELANVDAAGAAIPGESATLPRAYRFLRPRIVREADLTRLVRALLRELKRQVIENVSLRVALDFDDTPNDGLDVIAVAKLPSLVLTGPRLRENRFYSSNELHEEVVPSATGPELLRRRPAYTADLEFSLTAASDRAIELLNLMAAVTTFLNRNRWISIPRDPSDPTADLVRWEMDPQGEARTDLDGKDGVVAFSWGLVIRGVDIDEERLPIDIGRALEGTPDLALSPSAGPP